MTTTVELNAQQKQELEDTNGRQAQAIQDAARAGAVPANAFVFFAAFDGTNNDLLNHGNPQNTNVAQLWLQSNAGAEWGARVRGQYYPGPGTKGTLTRSSWSYPQVTEQVIRTAKHAYDDFRREAADWLRDHRGSPVTVVLTSFSRGGASAAIFSQMLYDRGLTDPAAPGQVLIPPGGVSVSTGVLFDPVMTGVTVDLAFAPNVVNTVDIFAVNEYRDVFKAADYSSQRGIATIRMLGNHSDIGGQYDNGIGALSLDAATVFLQQSGLPVAGVNPSRAYTRAQFNIHDENKNPDGTEKWSVYASFNSLSVDSTQRRLARVARADLPNYHNYRVT